MAVRAEAAVLAITTQGTRRPRPSRRARRKRRAITSLRSRRKRHSRAFLAAVLGDHGCADQLTVIASIPRRLGIARRCEQSRRCHAPRASRRVNAFDCHPSTLRPPRGAARATVDASQDGSVSEHGEHWSWPYAKPVGDGASYPSSPAVPEPEGKAPLLQPRHAARHCATTTQSCPDEAVRDRRVQPDVTPLGQSHGSKP